MSSDTQVHHARVNANRISVTRSQTVDRHAEKNTNHLTRLRLGPPMLVAELVG